MAKLGYLLPQHEKDFGRSFLNGIREGASMSAERWGAMKRRREELNRWCADTFERYDLLLTPTVPYDPPPAKGPFLAEVEGRKQPAANFGSFTMPFNMSWHPAATVRAGLSEAGLPVGLQIVAPRHRDDRALQAAYAFEQVRPSKDWPSDPFGLGVPQQAAGRRLRSPSGSLRASLAGPLSGRTSRG
jgi:aspartyl-tRNA(Asn)/glutamyl-tRNA(Gln) amidotransferase subunit A